MLIKREILGRKLKSCGEEKVIRLYRLIIFASMKQNTYEDIFKQNTREIIESHKCPSCNILGTGVGKNSGGAQRFMCKCCKKTFTETYLSERYRIELRYKYLNNALTREECKLIPKPTRDEWKKKGIVAIESLSFGRCSQENLELLAARAEIQKYKKRIRELAYLLVIYRNLVSIFDVKLEHCKLVDSYINIYVQRLQKNNIPHKRIWKHLPITYRQWQFWNKKRQLCKKSLRQVCKRKHSGQLTNSEVNNIKKASLNPCYDGWPLISIYYQLIRNKSISCCCDTFYRYCRLLDITKRKKKIVKKYTPIIADAPLKILHMDVTIYRPIDNSKLYIHIIRDNFSRAILGYKVATHCRSETSKQLLESVLLQNNLMNEEGKLITDGGSENKGELQKLIDKPGMLWKKLIAQVDIIQSNSMIEAANRILKYDFLFLRTINNIETFNKTMPRILREYNNRPAGMLLGLTPNEVLAGEIPDKNLFKEYIKKGDKLRRKINKKISCEISC
jgi:putative transposase